MELQMLKFTGNSGELFCHVELVAGKLETVSVHPSDRKLWMVPTASYGGMHEPRNSVQCGGTTWPAGATAPVAETLVIRFVDKNKPTGLLVAGLFVSQQQEQSHPRLIEMSKLPGGYGKVCACKVGTARMKAAKLQSDRNKWKIYFLIKRFPSDKHFWVRHH